MSMVAKNTSAKRIIKAMIISASIFGQLYVVTRNLPNFSQVEQAGGIVVNEPFEIAVQGIDQRCRQGRNRPQ